MQSLGDVRCCVFWNFNIGQDQKQKTEQNKKTHTEPKPEEISKQIKSSNNFIPSPIATFKIKDIFEYLRWYLFPLI